MQRLILKQEIIDTIKDDALLYGKVAYILDVNVNSLRQILKNNSSKLTEASVLRVISEHLKIENTESLLTEMPEGISQ